MTTTCLQRMSPSVVISQHRHKFYRMYFQVYYFSFFFFFFFMSVFFLTGYTHRKQYMTDGREHRLALGPTSTSSIISRIYRTMGHSFFPSTNPFISLSRWREPFPGERMSECGKERASSYKRRNQDVRFEKGFDRVFDD